MLKVLINIKLLLQVQFAKFKFAFQHFFLVKTKRLNFIDSAKSDVVLLLIENISIAKAGGLDLN